MRKQVWNNVAPMTTVQPLRPPEMAAWQALIRGFATVVRRLEGELEAEHGLTLGGLRRTRAPVGRPRPTSSE